MLMKNVERIFGHFYILGFRQVLPGVADMIHEVQVEGTFPDGTKLVSLFYHDSGVVLSENEQPDFRTIISITT